MELGLPVLRVNAVNLALRLGSPFGEFSFDNSGAPHARSTIVKEIW